MVAAALLLVMLTLLQDLVRARLQKTGYYFSESLLFSSFWWLFAPLWYGQYRWIQCSTNQPSVLQKEGIFSLIGAAVLPVGLHLILFPALVWAISAIAFNHTFRFEGTFTYALSEHLYLLLTLYLLPVLYARFIGVKKERVHSTNALEITGEKIAKQHGYPETFWVDGGSGSKIALPVCALAFCKSNTPYVNLHHSGKKHLHSTSLKALETQLDPARFVRIHKTTLVNVAFVTSVISRQNGDYDITLKSGEVLRVSRHFAAHFKERMEAFSLVLE